MSRIFAVVFVASLIGCATPTGMGLELIAGLAPCESFNRAQDGIVGGEVVSLGDPDQNLVTMLKIRRAGHDAVCTGTLISDRVVLTAAHCVAGVETKDVDAQFRTTLGCPLNQQKKISVGVKQMIIHREFDGSPRSLADLALLLLEDDAPRDQQRLRVVQESDKPTSDKVLFIGYGITGETEKDSQRLRRVYKSLSRDIHPRERALVVDQRDNAGFCRGDSGAPILGEIFGEPHVLAVNSANIGMQPDTECHSLSLAMDARFFSPWITGNRRALEGSTWLGRMFASSVQRL